MQAKSIDVDRSRRQGSAPLGVRIRKAAAKTPAPRRRLYIYASGAFYQTPAEAAAYRPGMIPAGIPAAQWLEVAR